jgi:hypothetical protein
MQEKLSQYDLLGRLVPGGALLWAANWTMTSSKSGVIPIVQGGITEAVAYALVAYVAGLFLDSVGRWIVEPLVYKLFGKPSRTFLNGFRGLSDTERAHYRQLANTRLRLSEEDALNDKTSSEKTEFVSQRVMTLFGQSTEKGKSMSVQYTLHRSLSAALILLLGWSLFLWTKGKIGWTPMSIELCCLVVFVLGVNHWGFGMMRATFQQLDADSLGVKPPLEPKAE